MSTAKKQLPRVIPCLLLKGHGLTKSVQFKDFKYVGDAVNACRIFNEKEVDELMFLDIDASRENKKPRIEFIKEIAGELFMPLGYGGGVTTTQEADLLFAGGVEKVSINTAAYTNPQLITDIANHYGSQSAIVTVDVRKPLIGGYKLYSNGGQVPQKVSLLDHLRRMEDAGAGEFVINSIDQDGKMSGFDLKLITLVSEAVSVPVVALGGAGNKQHILDAVQAGASAVAAGSMFVFHGKHRAVLITYPGRRELKELFGIA